MGCCSVTQRHTGTDEVGPDEIELLEINNAGLWSLAESRLQISNRNGTNEGPHRCPSVRQLKQEDPDPVSVRDTTKHNHSQMVIWSWTKKELHHRLYTQPIREWEGQAPHTYGDIIHSSSVYLHSGYTKAMSEKYLVLFSFHLLILALDSPNRDFIYEGILPLSAIEVHLISQQEPSSPHMFEISGPMVDSKIFICASAAETKAWMDSIEDRRNKSLRQQLSPSHSALSYLVPCDENWKKEELKRYLLRSPILQWEGTPIQHMGYPKYLSLVHINNVYPQDRLLQGPQERLLVLFPFDLLILSLDCHHVRVKYEGRLPLKSIKAMERSALPGRLEFELTGELMEPLLISCIYPEDYQSWIFQLQQPDKVMDPHHTPPPLIPKKRRS
ncbi:probable pleckstrin homology domain-containing family N member 1 isoform X1 [Pseudorasbora parva]|uniref:probable pleckstrin homology domain-containing family N member 1 isoform X1 n=1 Tax=Pseudorasbora parva TaxID=51549 RepID=UPI00351DD583